MESIERPANLESELGSLMQQMLSAREGVAKALTRVRSGSGVQSKDSQALQELLAARREANLARNALIARLSLMRQ